MDSRHKNANWEIKSLNKEGSVAKGDANLAVLMDIRDELQNLNRKMNNSGIMGVIMKIILRMDRRIAKKIKLEKGKK